MLNQQKLGVTMATKPPITITQHDYNGIYSLLDTLQENDSIDQLIAELERARIVAANKLPANTVRINSKVTFTVLSTGKTFNYELVYPSDMGEKDKLSILSPVGSAIIGLSVGQEIDWPVQGNKTLKVRIDTVSE